MGITITFQLFFMKVKLILFGWRELQFCENAIPTPHPPLRITIPYEVGMALRLRPLQTHLLFFFTPFAILNRDRGGVKALRLTPPLANTPFFLLGG